MKFFFTILFIFLTAYNPAFPQRSGEGITYNGEKGIYKVRYWSDTNETYYEIPLFPGNECNPIVKAEVSSDKEKFLYQYTLSNGKNAVRELYTFFVNVPSSVFQVERPNKEWTGKYLKWMNGVIWRQTNSASDTLGILPGKRVKGEFGFLGVELPGIVTAQASSYWNLGNTPDEGPSGEMRMKVDSLLEATKHVSFKTIGPRKLPENISNAALLDTLYSYLALSCDTTWISNRGICRSLQAKLDNVERQLERSNNRPAAGSLEAFLNQLNALKEKQISSEAYGLLYYNGQYLLEQLSN